MANTINNGSISHVREITGQTNSSSTGASQNKHPAVKPDASAEDSVALSERAEKLAALAASVGKTSEIDQAKVDQMKEALRDGSFSVDRERIADQLLQRENELP